MPSKMRHGLLIALMVIGVIVVGFGSSHAATTYTYDELNRLRIVDYGDGTAIEYNYDGAGNRLTVQSPAPPTGTITINSGAASTNNTSVMLTLSCTASQGCSQMQFSNDNITYSTPETYATTKAWTLTAGDGPKIVYVMFKDGLGRWSTPYSDTILVDTAPPTGTITINAGAASTNSVNVTLTLTCNDGSGSGCSYMQFSNNGGTYSSPEAYTTTKAWTLTTGDGLKTVYAKFQDGAGSWSNPPSNDGIFLYTTPPNRSHINLAFWND